MIELCWEMKPEVLPRFLDLKMRSFHFIQVQLGVLQNFMNYAFCISGASYFQWLQPDTDAASGWTLSSFQTAFPPKFSPQPELPVSLLLLNSYLIFSRIPTTWLLHTHTIQNSFCLLLSPYEPGLCGKLFYWCACIISEPSCSWPAIISLQLSSSGKPLIVYSFLLI